MKSSRILLTIFVLAFVTTSLPSSASTTVRWSGIVPMADCASKSVTNTKSSSTLVEKCKADFKEQEPVKAAGKLVVAFNI